MVGVQPVAVGDDGGLASTLHLASYQATYGNMSSSLTQLQESIAAGDYYSAHQKARTTATRLLAPPRRGPAPACDSNGFLPFDGKAQEAATLLYEGAVALLEKGQTGSAVDLGGYLCDVWKARGVPCRAEERGEFPVQQWVIVQTGTQPRRTGATNLRAHSPFRFEVDRTSPSLQIGREMPGEATRSLRRARCVHS